MLQVGQPAPPWKGQAYADGKFVDLSSDGLQGKWVVLFFYALDFTFV